MEQAADTDDLITRLRSPQGAEVRRTVLASLDELEARVLTALRNRPSRADYVALESSLEAVRAGRQSLERVQLATVQTNLSSALHGGLNKDRSES